MEEISVIGIDLAKQVFQICGENKAGEVVLTKRLKRKAFMKYMEQEAPRCLVGMEACGGAHYWARWLIERGFTVKLMAPRTVKAYRTGRHKNDFRDAHASCEAAGRPYVAGVAVKSETAQASQALLRVRELQIKQLLQMSNQLHGLLHEFGIVLPRGPSRMLEKLRRLEAEGRLAGLPATMTAIVRLRSDEIEQQAAKLKATTKALESAAQADANCALLMSIPQIGPVNATALTIALETPKAFRNGRAFASHLHLVPRQHASADTNVLLGVGELRANETRRYLVLAAQGLLIRAAKLKEPANDRLLSFARSLLARKHRNVAAVALANKLARIAWAVAATKTPFRSIEA